MLSGFKYGLALSISIGLIVVGMADLPAIAKAEESSLWTRIYRSLFGGTPPVPKGAGGSRPLTASSFCSVLPGQWKRGEAVMLRSRPTWIWRGEVESLQLEAAGTVVWQQESVNLAPDADGLTRMVYPGPRLVAGQQYRLVIKRRSPAAPITYTNFQTIEPESRSRLLANLYQVQESAWRSGKRGNALVQDRVKFLTHEGLWLDAAQEILMSPEISSEWREVKAGIVYETCDKPPANKVR